MAVVIHDYEEKDLSNLAKNEDADCVTCAFAEKIRTIDGVGEYLCKATLYDIKTLACYVPKEADCNG